MRKIVLSLIAVILMTGWTLTSVWSQDAAPDYIGADKCKLCHSKPKLGGAEYLKWQKDPHSNAYKSLLTDKAKEMAKMANVTDPANDEKCLKCHITTLKFTTEETKAEGVGCEKCHGPGSLYKTNAIMKDHEASVKAGMRRLKGATPEETLKNAEALCKECHGLEHKDENPAAKEFNFAEQWPKIKHDEETLKAQFPEAYQ